MMKRLLLLIIILTYACYESSGQVAAPDLLCVSNDTLKWENPVNTCGPFVSYNIFGSLNMNGPFDTIAVVTDPNASSFFHASAAGNDWFYFLQSNFDCPGQTALSSDTLDNKIPNISPIQVVSVGNNGVEIQWEPSPSPEVFAYIIYRETPTGTTVIDTVAGGTTFTDLNANTEDQVETYFVNSLDRCGNTSLFSNPHSTILLDTTAINACTQQIEMEWNLYQNWDGGIDRHEVWLSTNGSPFASVATLGSGETTYTFENADDLDTYCFFIRAYQAGTNFFSRSNVICETPDLVQPVKEFALLNASVTETDSVELTWVWDVRSEIQTFTVNSASDSFNLGMITEATPNLPLSNRNTFLDTDPVLIGTPRYYRIDATDDCGTTAMTNTAATMSLTATAQPGGNNVLSWTPYFNTIGTLTDYEVFRIIDGKEELLISSLQTPSYTDMIDLTNPIEANACYYIQAVANVTVPPGRIETVRSRSNTACVQQTAEVFVPNAFVPDGFNTEFRPILQFGTPAQYTMTIYDRWGGKLFETNSLQTGWDGKTNNKPLPQGIYAYHIRLVQSGGKVTVKKGTVLLLR